MTVAGEVATCVARRVVTAVAGWVAIRVGATVEGTTGNVATWVARCVPIAVAGRVAAWVTRWVLSAVAGNVAAWVATWVTMAEVGVTGCASGWVARAVTA